MNQQTEPVAFYAISKPDGKKRKKGTGKSALPSIMKKLRKKMSHEP